MGEEVRGRGVGAIPKRKGVEGEGWTLISGFDAVFNNLSRL